MTTENDNIRDADFANWMQKLPLLKRQADGRFTGKTEHIDDILRTHRTAVDSLTVALKGLAMMLVYAPKDDRDRTMFIGWAVNTAATFIRSSHWLVADIQYQRDGRGPRPIKYGLSDDEYELYWLASLPESSVHDQYPYDMKALQSLSNWAEGALNCEAVNMQVVHRAIRVCQNLPPVDSLSAEEISDSMHFVTEWSALLAYLLFVQDDADEFLKQQAAAA